MSDETGSPVGSEAIALPADAPETFDSPNAAAAYFTGLREKPQKEPAAESAEPEKAATAENELPDEGNADPETAISEEPQEAEPADLPPIERPRSWAKELDEEWASYPREAQEKIAKREQDRDAATRRSQNEAAEERKAAQAEREQAEKVRQQYEAQLPALMQSLQDAQQSSFADIRTVDDVTKLANEDPFRYLQWQAHQTKLQAVNAEVERAKGQQTQKQQTEWAEHVQKENALAAEYIPELADKTKGPALTQRVATELLPELGFKDSELADLAAGKSRLSIYDHRIQRLLADGLKLRDIQNSTKAVAAKPVPAVQRPGVAKPSGNATSERLQALTNKFNQTGDLKDAQALRAAQATSQRRAS
jgi:hypothetical protein